MSAFASLLPALAIGAAAAFTFGAALPALGLLGATTAIGGIGISGTAALVGGALGFSLGGALFGAPAPDVPGNLGRALENAADPEYPRRLVIGDVMVGSSWAYDHVFANGGGSDNGSHYALVSIIADHSIKGLVGIELNNQFLRWGTHLVPNSFYGNTGAPDPSGRWYLPDTGQVYVPVPWSAWDTNFSETGRYLKTSANRIYEVVVGGTVSATESTNETGNNFTSGTATLRYHMTSSDPAKGFHAFYQGERDGPRVWHYAVDLQKGNQTSINAWFDGRIAEYGDRNRVLRGLTYVAEMFVAHPQLSLGGSIPERRFRVEGADDIWDPRGADGYKNNAVLVAAYYLMWRFPGTITQSSFLSSNISACADLCDADIPGHAGEPKYTFDGVIEWSTDPGQALQMLCDHFRGGWFHRGDKILFWVGAPATSVGTLGPEHLVDGEEPIYGFERPPEERTNAVIAHYVQRTSSEADGQVWASKPAKKVTDAAMVAADNGVELRKDIHLNGVTSVKRAKYHASIVLNKARREFTVSGAFAFMSLPTALEVGDVVDWHDPEVGITNRKMQVERKVEADQSGHILMTLREFGDTDYQGSPIDDQDVVSFPKRYSTDIPVVGQPTVALIADTQKMDEKGRLKASVIVTWSDVNRFWVAAGGKYHVQWARQGTTGWRAITVDGHTLAAEVEIREEDWKFRVKAEDVYGNLSPSWSQNRDFTLDLSDDAVEGGPVGPDQDQNVIKNPKFAQAGKFWVLTDPDHFGTGSISIGAPFVPPEAPGNTSYTALLTADGIGNAPTAGDYDIRINPDRYSAVLPGEFYRVRAEFNPLNHIGDRKCQLGMLFYDADRNFVSPFVQLEVFTQTQSSALEAMDQFVQVPRGNDVRLARPEFQVRYDETNNTSNSVELRRMEMRQVSRYPASENVVSTVTDSGGAYQFVCGMAQSGVWAPPEGRQFKIIYEARARQDSLSAGTDQQLDLRVVRVRWPQDSDQVTVATFDDEWELTAGEKRQTHLKIVAFDTPPEDFSGTAQMWLYRIQGRTTGANHSVELKGGIELRIE